MSYDGGAVSADPDGSIFTDPNRKQFPRDPVSVEHGNFFYAKGKKLSILAHRPPQPFGSGRYVPPFDRAGQHATQDELKSRSPNDHVFTMFPRERQENSMAPGSASAYLDTQGTPTASLVVADILQAADGCGAQVVLCDVDKSESLTTYWGNMGYKDHPKQVVAKIYDPLFYPKDSPMATWIRIDTVSNADAQYAKEAAAYMEFHDNMDRPMVRDFVPRYYGAWTTYVKNEGWGCSTTRPAPNNKIQRVRPVRMVLMEYIEASRLHMVTDQRYDEDRGSFLDTSNLILEGHDHSLELYSRILRGLTALKFHGIHQKGLSTRNFLIAESEDGYTNPPELQQLGKFRVVMISHYRSTVKRYTLEGRNLVKPLGRPPHPVSDEFDPCWMSCLAGMFPLEWLDDINPYYDWALTTFRNEDYTYEDAVKQRLDEISGKKTEATKSDGSDKKSRDSGPEYMTSSSSESEPVPGLTTSVDTLDTLATSIDSLRSLQLGQPSTLMDTGRQGEPTAKEAGRKAEEAGITPVMEQGGEGEEGEDAHHDADDEKSPEDSPDQSPGQSPEVKTGETGEAGDKGKK